MVVAGDDDDAAVPGGTGGVGVAEDVAAAVHARPLAVPQPKTPSRAPGKRSSCWLPQTALAARSSLMPGWKTMWLSARCRLAFHRPGRGPPGTAAVAGNEAGGVESGGGVAQALQHGQADQGLGAGEIDAAGKGGVFVVQGNRIDGRARAAAMAGSPWLSPCGSCLVGAIFFQAVRRG